jgi:hypothetical protein
VELVKGREPDAPVKVIVQLPEMPRFHEQLLVDALATKMRQEYGDPPRKKKPEPPPPPPPPPLLDGGVDGGEETF